MTEQPVTDVVAYANLRVTMTLPEARRGLRLVLAAAARLKGGHPDAVGLGEWGRARRSVLRQLARTYRLRFVRPLTGGGPLGLNVDRYTIRRYRPVILTGPCRVEPDPGNPRRLLGPSVATEVIAYDHVLRERCAFLLYHFTAGIQAATGGLKVDSHPKRVARWKREEAALIARIAHHQDHGRTVYALGDSNYDGLELDGVTSAWVGHNDDHGGDLGRRRVSDVFGPGDAETALLADGSDHRALVAVRRRQARP